MPTKNFSLNIQKCTVPCQLHTKRTNRWNKPKGTYTFLQNSTMYFMPLLMISTLYIFFQLRVSTRVYFVYPMNFYPASLYKLSVSRCLFWIVIRTWCERSCQFSESIVLMKREILLRKKIKKDKGNCLYLKPGHLPI